MKTQTIFTVYQLIELLKAFPSDMPVITNGYEGEYENIVPPERLQVKYVPDEAWYNGQFHQCEEHGADNFEAVVIAREVRPH
jgi:hypothetical protein